LFSGISPRILPTAVVSKIRPSAWRSASAALAWSQNRRLKSMCAIARAGVAISNRRAPPICPSLLAAKVRQVADTLMEYSTNSSAVLGEKSSHTIRRRSFTQLQAIGQAQVGKGSVSSII
jgi:hypothetical protein